ncbi:MAG: secondary thiamine-phosphate synthase enzyme YjbQ [Acidobacteriota bacterium]
MNLTVMSAEPAAQKAEGSAVLRFFSKTFQFNTEKRLELYNITSIVADIVREFKVREGFINISTLHTTTAMFVNEFQKALLDDIKMFLSKIVNSDEPWRHNSPDCSDCDRQNADSHLRALLFGHNLQIPITNGKLALGQWQSIILAELDGPRERTLTAQVFGSAMA